MVAPIPTRSFLGAVTRWRLMFGAVSRTLVASLALSAAGLVGIANWERFVPRTYNDAVGVPTIGYGTTEGVQPGQTITPERALVKLLDHVDKDSAAAVRRCVTVPLYQHEFDAYVSLTYNIGSSNFCNSTLVKLLNQGQYVQACDQILRWDKAGGRVLRGLTLRRQAERRICLGEAANDAVARVAA